MQLFSTLGQAERFLWMLSCGGVCGVAFTLIRAFCGKTSNVLFRTMADVVTASFVSVAFFHVFLRACNCEWSFHAVSGFIWGFVLGGFSATFVIRRVASLLKSCIFRRKRL